LDHSARQPEPDLIGEATDDPRKAAAIALIPPGQPLELHVEKHDEPECAAAASGSHLV